MEERTLSGKTRSEKREPSSEILWWSYFGVAKPRKHKAASGSETEMKPMFTGTLIEDLIATVERVEELSPSDEILICESLITDGLITIAQQSGDYDSKLFWQESGMA